METVGYKGLELFVCVRLGEVFSISVKRWTSLEITEVLQKSGRR